jgi:hypothetical protein
MPSARKRTFVCTLAATGAVMLLSAATAGASAGLSTIAAAAENDKARITAVRIDKRFPQHFITSSPSGHVRRFGHFCIVVGFPTPLRTTLMLPPANSATACRWG